MVIKPTKMIWSGHLARMGEMRNVYILSTITEKKLLERPELKWQDDKYESGECVRLQTVS
jgi:hypothetical protein